MISWYIVCLLYRYTRSLLSSLACNYDIDSCTREAAKMFKHWMMDPERNRWVHISTEIHVWYLIIIDYHNTSVCCWADWIHICLVCRISGCVLVYLSNPTPYCFLSCSPLRHSQKFLCTAPPTFVRDVFKTLYPCLLPYGKMHAVWSDTLLNISSNCLTFNYLLCLLLIRLDSCLPTYPILSRMLRKHSLFFPCPY